MRFLARSLPSVLLALFLVLGPPGGRARVAAESQTDSTLECVLMTWDAAQASCTQRLVEEGRLPHLASLAVGGMRMVGLQTSFPSKTAPGHASLFTGCYTAASGIAANQVPVGPDAQHDILDLASGFDPRQLRAEPFWQATARQGKRTLVQFAPFSPPEPGRRHSFASGNLRVLSGYENQKSAFQVVDGTLVRWEASPSASLPRHEGEAGTFTFQVGDSTLRGAVLDTTFDGRQIPDTLLLSTALDYARPRTVSLSAAPEPSFSRALVIRHGDELAGVHFMLLSMGPSPRAFRLVRSSTAIERVNGSGVDASYIEETGGFVGNGPTALYESGALGKPFYDGGDGQAEARYLAAVGLIVESAARKTRHHVRHFRPQVLVSYLPYPDEALHTWLGFAGGKAHGRPAWRCLEDVFRRCDDYLGSVLALAGTKTVVAVASDHGMTGVEKAFHPNVVLRQAGLLASKADGKIDLGRTRILYGYEDGAFLRVNRARYRNGIVSPSQEREVVEKAVSALSAVRDPETGMAVVTGYYYPDVDAATFGFGGPRGGDVYLDLAPGFTFHPSPVGTPVARLAHPQGVHVFNPLREDMRAIFYARGPGIPAGRILPPVRSIRIVPTLSALLGIEPPRDCREKPLSW